MIFFLFCVLTTQGNMGACLQLLARGTSLNPADPALYQARGIVEKESRRYDAARAMFQQGIQIDPRHLYLWQVREGGSGRDIGRMMQLVVDGQDWQQRRRAMQDVNSLLCVSSTRQQ